MPVAPLVDSGGHDSSMMDADAGDGDGDPDGRPTTADGKEPWSRKRATSSTGFLGLTSYWATLDETDGHPPDMSNGGSSPDDGMDIEPEQIRLGARVLALLEDFDLYACLISFRFRAMEPWVLGEPIGRAVVGAFRELVDAWLRPAVVSGSSSPSNHNINNGGGGSGGGSGGNPPGSRHADDAQWYALARKVFDNSARPLATPPPSVSLEDYCRAIAPRWEMIGLFFAWVGIATTSIPRSDPALRTDNGDTLIDANMLSGLATHVVEVCSGFCDSAGTVNDPMSWMLHEQVFLLSICYGDSDYRTWRKLGDLSTLVFAFGLHQPQPDTPSLPFFLTELRRRVMVGSFAYDKQLASFLGRPPRIAYQYCDMVLPVDVPWEELVGSPERREAALRSVDSRGWHHGAIHKCTLGRLHHLLLVVREKILALSLSPRIAKEDIRERVA